MFPHFDVSKAIGLATSSRDYAYTLNIRKSSPRFTQFLDSLEGTSTWNYILRDRYKTTATEKICYTSKYPAG